MATEAAASTNGVYNNGYHAQEQSQSNLPSAPSQTGSTQANAASITGKPDPLEIGWYFVEQYYTTLSKNPDRIHLFYSKKSQLITGLEAEKVMPSVGQKAISEKIKELDFEDCKVRVLNVDSQASFQNIVVQVIGEISNKSQPHHKFVQTFVLAEQPNGYFVLNDIFRYLNEDEEELAEEDPVPETVEEESKLAVEAPPIQAKHSGESIENEAAAEQLDAKLEEMAQDEVEPTVETNGVVEPEEEAEPVQIPAPSAATLPMETTLAPENPSEPEPSPARTPPKEVTPAAQADTAPVKKTWANMVGSKAAASPVSGPPAQSSALKASTPVAPATPVEAAQGNGWQTADHGKKQNRTQVKPDQTVLAYVKNVSDKVDARVLRTTLEEFGELKYFDVSRPKNCAFVEFATSEGYNAAAAANPHVINGESILVEERRPRTGQYASNNTAPYNRGGGQSSRGRGGFQQGRPGSQSGGFPKDASRSNFQQGRGGGKGGNVASKGRGQAQPA